MKTRTCAWPATLLVAALAPASPASGVSPLVYVDSNDQIIGHQFTMIHKTFDHAAEIIASLHSLAQHVAG